MAKVTARKETGKLVIDFTYRGVRCREQTALIDTPQNRKRAGAVVQRIKTAIVDGSFDYAEFFPGSPLASRFAMRSDAQVLHITAAAGASAVTSTIAATPAFRNFTTTWLAEHQVEWRRSHLKVLKSTIDGHLLPAFGDRPVGSITKTEILAFRAKLAELPGRTGEKLSNKRINGILAPLGQILSDAAERYDFVSPALKIRRLKVRKSDVNPFTLDEVQSILKTVRLDWRDYFTVRFLTGMRTGEAHGLKWKYIDFEHRLILVRETFVLGEDDETKTEGSMRDIQMSQPVYEALQRQHSATSKLSEYVFCNREGHPIDNKNFSDRVWYPLLRHLGLTARRPYQMRHTAATLWLASGEAPEWIARQLGHANTQMLFTTYSRYVPNLTRRDGSAIDRLLATRFATGNAETAAANDAEAAASPRQAHPPPAVLKQAA